MEEIKELFLELVSIGAPSGFEEPVMKAVVEKLRPLTDRVWDTPIGNVIGVQEGTDPEAPKVAIVAHMDQVGFVVSNIDEKGFLRFKRLGGAATRTIQGQQMKVITPNGPINGVAGIKPGHVTKPSEAYTVPQLEEMYIDIGARSKQEALEMGVKNGTPIVWGAQPYHLANNYIATPGADDRAGLTAMISIAKNLSKEKIPSTIYYVGTIEEENGLRGAAVALYNLDVDLAVAIDTSPAGWQPDVSMRDIYYEMGKGPAIHVGEGGMSARTGSRIVREWLIETAESEGIPYQSGFMYGGTDASAIRLTKSGIPASTIGIPRRYSHSPVEMLNMDDLSKLIEIVTKSLKKLDKDFKLHRI